MDTPGKMKKKGYSVFRIYEEFDGTLDLENLFQWLF